MWEVGGVSLRLEQEAFGLFSDRGQRGRQPTIHQSQKRKTVNKEGP